MKTFYAGLLACGLIIFFGLGLAAQPGGDKNGPPDKKKKKGPSSASDRPASEDGDFLKSGTGEKPGSRVAPTEYWPRFRGPDGLGVSADRQVPTEWSDTKNLKWKLALPGPGTAITDPLIVRADHAEGEESLSAPKRESPTCRFWPCRDERKRPEAVRFQRA